MPCLTEITTASGTFIAHNEAVGREEARKICNNENSILAPIVSQADKDAILKLTSSKGCRANSGWFEYHIGLEVTPSCKNKQKYFANGVAWDEQLHSHLYKDETTSDYALAVSVFVPIDGENSLRIVDCTNDNYCKPFPSRFICFREAKTQSCASGLGQENGFGGILSNFSYMLSFVFIAFIVLFSAKRYYSKKTMLEN